MIKIIIVSLMFLFQAVPAFAEFGPWAGASLNDLNDVKIDAVAANDTIIWDDVLEQWINSPMSGGNATANDTVYNVSWNGSTTQIPSQNAVYDKIETMPQTAGDRITLTGTDLDVDVGPVVNGDTGNVTTPDAVYDFVAAGYQPLESTLTDLADGTIAENLVNTANPWAADEIVSTVIHEGESAASLTNINASRIVTGTAPDSIFTIGGDVSGPLSNLQIIAATVGPAELAATAVAANTYGSATVVPVITVDADGRITGVTNSTISTNATAGWQDIGASMSQVVPTDNVGIGRTDPGAKLDIRGVGTGAGLALRVSNSAGTHKLVVLDSGNVGIGTTSPTAALHVVGGIKTDSFELTGTGDVTLDTASNMTLQADGDIIINGTWKPTKLAPGTNGHVLTGYTNGTTVWAAATGGSGGGALYREYTFTPQGAILDDNAPPEVYLYESTGTGTPRYYVAEFSGSVNQTVYHSLVVPSDYNTSGSIYADFNWFTDNATAGKEVCWGVSVSATTAGDTDTPVEQAVGTINVGYSTVNTAEAGRLVSTTVTLANNDSMAANDTMILRVQRVPTHANDTVPDSAGLQSIRLRIPR